MHEEMFLGHKVKVGTTDEIADRLAAEKQEAFYVCMRCVDQPFSTYPPIMQSVMGRTLCERCGELVWYDTTNLVSAVTIVCVQCMPKNHTEIASQASLDRVRRGIIQTLQSDK